MTVSEKIKTIRKEKGLSQKELGSRLGVSQQMVEQYENHTSEPKIGTLRKIAAALEVELSDLLEVVEGNMELEDVEKSMKIVESILTKNPCYRAGKTIQVKGLMLHSVGCPQPSAQVFIKMWNQESYRSACVHGFIDGNEGTVYQTLPWNHRGWHCDSGSKGSGNNTHIGVEMCEPSCIKYTYGTSFTCSNLVTAKVVVKRTYEAAVELFAMLCKKYNLNPLEDGVIISHKEGSIRGIASNHGDPEHLWNGLGMNYTMDSFRKAVASALRGLDQKDTWMQEQNGRWWYRHADGNYTQNNWEQIGGKWYYFDEKGWMQTGWIFWKGKWYYCDSDGMMVSNQILTISDSTFGDEVYAFAADGHMLTQKSSRGALV